MSEIFPPFPSTLSTTEMRCRRHERTACTSLIMPRATRNSRARGRSVRMQSTNLQDKYPCMLPPHRGNIGYILHYLGTHRRERALAKAMESYAFQRSMNQRKGLYHFISSRFCRPENTAYYVISVVERSGRSRLWFSDNKRH